METLQELNADVFVELQKMLDTPIENQAAPFELDLLGMLLGNGLQALTASESDEETVEALREVIKTAFVIGRRHANRLV
jgi:hypothetical protein